MESCTSLCFSPLLIGKLIGAAFFAILFLQSGYDKLDDWKGNLSWIKGYFEKTSLARLSFIMLALLTVLEFSAGLFSFAGIITTFVFPCSNYLLFALLLSGLSLIALFFGMRVSKDYTSAAALAGYFAVWIGWAILLSL
jgi:hypothetical protein